MNLYQHKKSFTKLILVVSLIAAIFLPCTAFAEKAKDMAYEQEMVRKSEANAILQGWSPTIPFDESKVTFGVSTVSRTGSCSATIKVEPDAKPAFYEMQKDISGVKPGEVYKMTAWIKTENQTDGVGAYMGIGALKAEYPYSRFVSGDAERVTGTSDWTKVSCVLFVPPGVHTIRQIILIHGTGQAYFDDIVFEKIDSFQSVENNSPKIHVTNEVTTEDFIGFGFEDDAFFYTQENLSEMNQSDIELRNRRIAELSPSVIATLFWWDAICPDKNLDNVTYDTEQFKALIRTLRPHQQAGRKVFMGDVFWGWSRENFPYSMKNVEKGIEIYSDAVEYLVKQQGLECIKYVCISGEVDMVFESYGGSFESYLKACRLLRKKLDQAGLTDIKIIGDKSGGFVWIEEIIPILDDLFGIFTIHEYPEITQYPLIDYRIDRMVDIVQDKSEPIVTASGKKKYKPIFLYEIGALESSTMSTPQMGSVMPRYEYPLYCANTAISGLNRGLVGGSVWCLHSMYYPGRMMMDWGIWEYKNLDWKIRPVYYGYGLFTKYAKPGMNPLKVDVSPEFYDFSAAALRDSNGKRIVYILNFSDTALKADISGLNEGAFEVFEYSRDTVPSMGEKGYGRVDSLKTGKIWKASQKSIDTKPESIIMLKEI